MDLRTGFLLDYSWVLRDVQMNVWQLVFIARFTTLLLHCFMDDFQRLILGPQSFIVFTPAVINRNDNQQTLLITIPAY